MNYLLLKNKNKCPRCGNQSKIRWQDSNPQRCRYCGLHLFTRSIDFFGWEADGLTRIYWLWDNQHGWMYRDHVILGLKARQADEDAKEAKQEVKAVTKKMIKHSI